MAFPFHKQNIKYKNIIIISSKNLGIWGGDTQSCSLPQKYKNISYVTSLKLRDSCMVSPCHKNIFNKFAQGYGDTLQGCHKKGDMGTHCAENTKYKNIFVVFSQGYGDRLQGCSCHRKSPTFLLISTQPSFLSTFS